MASLNRQPDESVLDYQIRICRDKDVLGLSWQNVSDLMAEQIGESYSTTRWRKFWSHFKQGMDYARTQQLSSDELLQRYESKRIEMEKERVKLSDQRREYNKAIRNQARSEHLQELIHNAIGRVQPLTWNDTQHMSYSYREGLMVLNDWHKGLFANNYWNQFNDDEFYRRVRLLVDKSVTYAQSHGIDVMHVFLLGDMVNGLLRPTTRILSTENVVDQTIHVAEALAEVLAEYANQFNDVRVYTTQGNHSRAMASKIDAIDSENYDRIVTWYLQARLQHIGNIEFVDNVYDVDIISATIAGHKVYGAHGDKDKVGNVVQNLTLMTGEKPSHIILGHIHKYARDEIHGTKVIVCPSLCGVDTYAKDIRVTSDAAQNLIIFDENEGELCTYHIKLGG